MTITTAQLNSAKVLLLDAIITNCPEADQFIVRAALQRYKTGNAVQKEAAQAILQQWYQARFGRLPSSFIHNFKQEIRSVIQPFDSRFPVTPDDAVDPETTNVT